MERVCASDGVGVCWRPHRLSRHGDCGVRVAAVMTRGSYRHEETLFAIGWVSGKVVTFPSLL